VSGINPNSAFARQYFDLPTPVAIQLESVVKASGKSKKQFLTDLVTEAVRLSSQSVSTPAKRTKKS
jgi:hypothetical protein